MAGVGGGGIVVPLTMIFFGFTIKEAIAISGFIIFACALSRYLFYLSEKHPDKETPIVNYDLATVMLPLVMVGSMLGVMVNLMFPSLILQVVLTVLLIVLTRHSYLKAVQIYRKENEKLIY